MENKKRTFMEDLKMILKGIGIWQKITPSYIILEALYKARIYIKKCIVRNK